METAQLRLCRFSGLQAIEQGRGGVFQQDHSKYQSAAPYARLACRGSVNIHRLCAVEHSRVNPSQLSCFSTSFQKFFNLNVGRILEMPEYSKENARSAHLPIAYIERRNITIFCNPDIFRDSSGNIILRSLPFLPQWQYHNTNTYISAYFLLPAMPRSAFPLLLNGHGTFPGAYGRELSPSWHQIKIP